MIIKLNPVVIKLLPHIAHLSKDSKLKKLIVVYPAGKLVKSNQIYFRLCTSILSQQLSTRVASVLKQRFLNLYAGEVPDPVQILDTTATTFREIGFSHAKAGYVHNVCRFFLDNKLTDVRLHQMNDEELIELLTQIKGIGRWTVEMLLIFSMQREDVFAYDDLGLRQGVIKLYNVLEEDKKRLREKVEKIVLKWSPYRSYASLYLWQMADEKWSEK